MEPCPDASYSRCHLGRLQAAADAADATANTAAAGAAASRSSCRAFLAVGGASSRCCGNSGGRRGGHPSQNARFSVGISTRSPRPALGAATTLADRVRLFEETSPPASSSSPDFALPVPRRGSVLSRAHRVWQPPAACDHRRRCYRRGGPLRGVPRLILRGNGSGSLRRSRVRDQ